MNLSDKLTGRKSYGQYYARLESLFKKPSARASELVSLTLFTVVFFVVFAIIPTFKTIGTLKREIDDAKNVEAKLQQKIHSLNQAETLYGQVLPQLAKIDRVLPTEPEFERLAWQLHWLAAQNQVVLNSGSFGEFPFLGVTPKANELASLEVSLSLTGPYLNIKSFIAALNQLDRLIKISEASITNKGPKTVEQNQVNANLKLTAYYLPL